ncbi:uncharacterized protein PODANS_1_23330 [Podospora anserina S mat+]|uniref:Podospora anserina S mat+ genomic DNA chromosome 1, supercontig 6 n=6 Tax=Podospora TaxID=5144 RepID=B2ASF3_PODAN|nr:uncharacterized protein PODANS_1_23330 [Podospora anserina S mat+]KAK4647199.1 hypothetical protein QC761_123330 [Podospora bellae-mahoneyi]KAK4660928.1 hypothetical protein QC762_123330 [Podospora pseudocomata]KAK4674743.1 hypothetical protein QC763_123330 [Podospora pseudopauciseta]KAK4683236.1 hypothetical protein QC764_123330 [Podospora pseudoanserina]VBB73980.1 Putative protein of unknown function [Podospora comata]
MRATTTILFIASLASTAFGAATKMFDDENCQNEVDKKVFNGFSTGDAPLTDNIKSIRTDSRVDTWFAYQRNDGEGCKGDLITRVNNGDCIKVSDLGIGCTRLCASGLGAGSCVATTIP